MEKILKEEKAIFTVWVAFLLEKSCSCGIVALINELENGDINLKDGEGTCKKPMTEDEIAKTALPEYLDIVKAEYENERAKRQNLENRAGLLMALLGAICVFLFEQVKLSDVIGKMVTPLTFVELIFIVSGLIIYVGLLFVVVELLRVLSVRKQTNFRVENITPEVMRKKRAIALCELITAYISIIKNHRELNEKLVKIFKKALYGTCLIFIAIIIHIAVNTDKGENSMSNDNIGNDTPINVQEQTSYIDDGTTSTVETAKGVQGTNSFVGYEEFSVKGGNNSHGVEIKPLSSEQGTD